MQQGDLAERRGRRAGGRRVSSSTLNSTCARRAGRRIRHPVRLGRPPIDTDGAVRRSRRSASRSKVGWGSDVEERDRTEAATRSRGRRDAPTVRSSVVAATRRRRRPRRPAPRTTDDRGEVAAVEQSRRPRRRPRRRSAPSSRGRRTRDWSSLGAGTLEQGLAPISISALPAPSTAATTARPTAASTGRRTAAAASAALCRA